MKAKRIGDRIALEMSEVEEAWAEQLACYDAESKSIPAEKSYALDRLPVHVEYCDEDLEKDREKRETEREELRTRKVTNRRDYPEFGLHF